jgi:predicted MFS family arabinose efflux permease
MISDAFPPERRATALSVYQLGVPLGALFGLAFGGYLAEELGWRAAFFLVGAPGILLAGVAKLSLREPARGAFDAGGDVEIEPLGDTLRFMAGLPAMRHVVVGSAVQTLFLAGLAAFHGSFLIRVHGLSLTEAGLKLGLINGIAGGFAVLGAGWLADRVGQSDLRWQFWIPAAGALVSIPFSVIAYQTESVDLAIASIAAATIFNNTYSGLTHAIMQRLVKPRMRAMMSAIALFAMNIVGFGLGPIAVGFLSDRFGGGSEIRYALLSLVICMAWAAVHYLIGARSYLRDLEAKNA